MGVFGIFKKMEYKIMEDKIIIDINYFYDENNKKVFDVENMTNVFNECIKNLECLEK